MVGCRGFEGETRLIRPMLLSLDRLLTKDISMKHSFIGFSFRNLRVWLLRLLLLVIAARLLYDLIKEGPFYLHPPFTEETQRKAIPNQTDRP
jgi:hypothetical protein